MSPRRLSHCLAIACLALPSLASAGGYTPDEAVARMVVPDGFHVEVVAAEPMIRQPVTASFDERGRLWVIEYLQYPNPAGLKPVTVDQYLRTEYDRVPEPAAERAARARSDQDPRRHRRRRADRQGDGLRRGPEPRLGAGRRPRRRLRRPGAVPALLSRPGSGTTGPTATRRSCSAGSASRTPTRRSTRWPWGPDGWLYGAQGSTVTAKIRGIEFQQGIWRYHPRTKQFELFAEGGGNTWGLDFDKAGNAFGSSNGGFIAFHMVQGGYYWKGFAKHGPLHNPRTYRLLRRNRLRRPQAGRARHARRDHLQGRRLSARIPRRVHRRQPAVEHRLLARASARRLDLPRQARRDADRRPRPLVPADRPHPRPRRLRLRRRLVRPPRQPPRPARQLGQDQRADLPRRLRGAEEAPAVRPEPALDATP